MPSQGDRTRRLLAAVRSQQATQDALLADFRAEMVRVLRATERDILLLFRRVETLEPSALARLAQLARVRQEIREALGAAGYIDLVDAVADAGLARLVERVGAVRQAAGLSRIIRPDVTRIRALQILMRLDLQNQGDEVATSLWRAGLRVVLSRQSFERAVKAVAAEVDRSERLLASRLDTQLSIFTRQVEAIKAGPDRDSVFLYLGPADGKIRPFCFERVGKVFTRAEIDRMDNGQLADPFVTGGGYNCRHTWIQVSRLGDLASLIGTGERVPEVQRQLDARIVPARGRRAA